MPSPSSTPIDRPDLLGLNFFVSTFGGSARATGSDEAVVAVNEEVQQARESAQTYLRVAEAVLEASHSPLSAREIVERGIERGLFGDHNLSRTPEKSMQARLSLDIKRYKGSSRFMRVARGRFLLRSHQLRDEFVPSQSISTSLNGLAEYFAEPRKLRLPSEEVLSVPERYYKEILTFQGIDNDYDDLLPKLLAETIYINRVEAEERNDAKQFITYVLLQCGHRLLSFRRSYLSRAAEFLRGAKCIGFGGHVSAADHNMFSGADLGIEACARRELSEELALVSPDSTRRSSSINRPHDAAALFYRAPIECLGILNDDSSEVGRRHLAVVYRAWLKDWDIAETISKGEASLRTLNWIDLTNAKIDISEYEYWSQLCLRRFYPSNVISEPVIKHFKLRATQRARIFAVAGRIGSGKSEISSYLARQLGAEVISSGVVLQHLMGVRPLHELGREEFQKRAQDFIRTPDGPKLLARALGEAASQTAGRVVIDGIRQIETYEELAKFLGERPALLYVHTPPDVAYEMYRIRESGNSLDFTYRDFLRVYDAPVETDLSTLGRYAQTYIYNFLGKDALRRSLDKLVRELN